MEVEERLGNTEKKRDTAEEVTHTRGEMQEQGKGTLSRSKRKETT